MSPILNRVKFTTKKIDVNQHDYGLNLPVTLGKKGTNGEANAKGKGIGQGGKENEIHEERKRESIKVVCTDIERRITMTNRQLNVI